MGVELRITWLSGEWVASANLCNQGDDKGSGSIKYISQLELNLRRLRLSRHGITYEMKRHR